MRRILQFIDENAFPENILPVKIVKEIKSKYGKEIPKAEHYFDEGEKGEMLNEHYQINKIIDKKKINFDTIVKIAVHEVRHRVQYTFPIELFTRDNWKKFEENIHH